MLKNNKVLLASSNQGKIREFKKIFKGFDVISQEDLGIDDAVEDGISFFENALKKLDMVQINQDSLLLPMTLDWLYQG